MPALFIAIVLVIAAPPAASADPFRDLDLIRPIHQKQALPSMERLCRRYKDRGLTMLAISTDSSGARGVADFVKTHGLTFLTRLERRYGAGPRPFDYLYRGIAEPRAQ